MKNKEALIKEYSEKMRVCVNQNYDPEMAHSNADDLLIEFLDKLGFTDITYLYAQVKKWYA